MKKLLILLLFLNSFVYSFDKFAFGYATTTYDAEVYNVTFTKDLDYELLKTFPISLEFAVDTVNSDNNDEDFTILSIQPTFTYNFNEDWFVDAGIGAAYFSQKDFQDRQFGTNYQFKESISLGYRINPHITTNLGFTHFSNANLDDDNDGFDMYMINLRYEF